MHVLRRIPYYGSLALLVYMPFHVFLSQSLSLLTGGLNEWKVAKDVFLAGLTTITMLVVWLEHRATRLFALLVGLTMVYAIVLLGVWAAHPHIYKTSALLGTAYDLRLFCYVIVAYGAGLLTQISPRAILKLVLVISTIVALLGIIQYFLPTDILTHFGYSLTRGVRPAFFIDNNPEFPRIMSTIRDPNSLGDYLLLPISLLCVLLLRRRNHRLRIIMLLALVAQLVAVYLSFSRSAWLATGLVVALIVWWEYHAWFIRSVRRFWPIALIVVALLGVGAYSQRHNPLLTHQTKLQIGSNDSNQLHIYFVEHGLAGMVHEPFGHGPGTAGLASIHNPKGSNLTENYYLQVGYEAGFVGLAIFVFMQLLLYVRLWPYRRTYIGVTLLATFWGYVLINMVLQEWDNEAVAAQWWIVAGFALQTTRLNPPKSTGL